MRRIDWLVSAGLFFSLTMLPVSAFGEEDKGPSLHDCGKRICGEWKAKGENTCRTCTTAQCKTENGGEVLAGSKKETECYEGHGSPPSEDSQE